MTYHDPYDTPLATADDIERRYPRNGYKLYNEEDSFFSWHECLDDAEARQRFEQETFGRSFGIARVTDAEWDFYGARMRNAI